MHASDAFFGDGVVSFFLCVGIATGVASVFAGWSPITIVSCVVASLILTAVTWAIFASYPRDIWQMPRLIATLVFALVRATIAYVLRGCKPVFPEWTFKFELLRAGMRALRGGVFAQHVVKSRQSRYFSKMFELLGKRKGPKSCEQHGTKMEIVNVHGMEHVWIRECDRDPTKTRIVVIYYHGGGYVLFAPHYFVDLMNRVRTSMVNKLRHDHPDLTNISVECFLANYRKSPDFKYPIPQQDALLMFEHVVNHENVSANRIFVMGDSAGGALCMSTMLRLKAKGSPMPAGAMLSCPFVDFAAAEDADDSHCMLALELGRQMLLAHHPTPEDRSTWKDGSAVYCDLRGLPPAIIQVGSVDTIYASSIKLYEKAKSDGLGDTWELDVFPHMPHAFTCLPQSTLPDVAKGIDHLAHFAVRQIARGAQK